MLYNEYRDQLVSKQVRKQDTVGKVLQLDRYEGTDMGYQLKICSITGN